MEYLPITVQLKNRQCLIVGGGEVAFRKLKHLAKAGAEITLVAPDFIEEITELAIQEGYQLLQQRFNNDLIDKQYLIIAATDEHVVNQQVSQAAKAKNIWVNVVDDLELSSFIMPAVIDRSPLLVAVSTGGVSPVLARIIREKIEWLLPKNLGALLTKLKQLRPTLKKNTLI